jgi:hypothetical protein
MFLATNFTRLLQFNGIPELLSVLIPLAQKIKSNGTTSLCYNQPSIKHREILSLEGTIGMKQI